MNAAGQGEGKEALGVSDQQGDGLTGVAVKERRVLSYKLHLFDEEQNRIRRGRIRKRPQTANCDFQAIQKTHATVDRSRYSTLADENQTCKGR